MVSEVGGIVLLGSRVTKSRLDYSLHSPFSKILPQCNIPNGNQRPIQLHLNTQKKKNS